MVTLSSPNLAKEIPSNKSRADRSSSARQVLNSNQVILGQELPDEYLLPRVRQVLQALATNRRYIYSSAALDVPADI